MELLSRIRVGGETLITITDQEFYESKAIRADSNFFAIFPYKFINGNPQKALSQPYTAVITRAGPSHLDFNICLSYHSTHFQSNWFMKNHDTYVVLKPNASLAALKEKAKSIYGKYYAASYTNGASDEPGKEFTIRVKCWIPYFAKCYSKSAKVILDISVTDFNLISLVKK